MKLRGNYRRRLHKAQYVIEETQRVRDVSDALQRGDYETVGQKCMRRIME